MDGKGAWRDECLRGAPLADYQIREGYPRAYANVSGARASIGRYSGFYKRPTVTRVETHASYSRRLFRQTGPPYIYLDRHLREVWNGYSVGASPRWSLN
jgi:hypothetical protein